MNNKLTFLVYNFIVVLFIANQYSLYSNNKIKSNYINKFPLYIYSDYGSKKKMHFFPSGYSGDIFAVTLVGNYKKRTYRGKSCIKITYDLNNPKNVIDGWISIHWLNPANNWAFISNAGYNLNGAKKLVFFARGELGGEKIKFKIGGVSGKYPDSDVSYSYLFVLSNKWEKYVLNIKKLNLSHIISGLSVTVERNLNPNGVVFYMDEIYYSD